MQTTLHACTLLVKPINAPAIPSNQAYHRSCKRQWLIRQKATYITFFYHEQTSISSKSGTRLPWKDTQGDLSRTYHCPWEKPETYSMSSHAYKRRGGSHSKGRKKMDDDKKNHHRKPLQGHCKSHPKPSKTTTRSLQKSSQTIGDHHKVTANAIPNNYKPSQGHCKTIIIKPPQGLRKTIIIKFVTSHHKITARSPSHTIKS